MENTNQEIYFNFSYYALNLLGKQMYSTQWSAISELVANGIDAGSKLVRVYINTTNQKKSTIEIFDDGSGMNYNDLATKYAYIGRDKRADADVDNTFMGRKGVGKLAALYLAKKYYILSKIQNEETAWVLDSINAKDSDMPRLDKINVDDVNLENKELWESYSSGTMIRLVDVDLTNFADRKLISLKQRIANYYLLENLESKIEVAYITNEDEKINFSEVKKVIAYKNFYALFESTPKLVSTEISEKVKIRTSNVEGIDTRRKTIVFNSDKSESSFKLKGEIDKIPYELKGWIGIHATIANEIAFQNDDRFVRNNVYNPNRLRLYVRNKLAVENFLDVLKSSQAFANYIEGEISFDILDDDRLPDIATTSRESISDSDGRVSELKKLLRPIVGRLITERSNIGTDIRTEEQDLLEEKRRAEERKAEDERKAKDIAILEKNREMAAREEAEATSVKLSEEKSALEKENISLDTQNKIKNVLLSESDPQQDKLLGHELTGIREIIETTTSQLIENFQKSGEYNRISEYVKEFKYSSIKLDVIRKQFLKLNNYDMAGSKIINIKLFLRSYLENLPLNKRRLIDKNMEISDIPFVDRIDIFEFGVLIDNIIQNAKDRNAKYIKVIFDDKLGKLSFTSDTGPIRVEPIDRIFDLGVTTKEEGTGVGLYLVKRIVAATKKWHVHAENHDNEFWIVIDLGESL